MAQNINEKKFLIVPCKASTLVIDGLSVGEVKADDPNRQILTFGEYYLQLKTATGKFNLAIIIDENTKNIVPIGCDAIALPKGVKFVDKNLNLGGLLIDDTEQNVLGLDFNDELILNCTILNKKGTATLFIQDVNNGNEIYKKENFRLIENEIIKIPAKSIYRIVLYTDAVFGKEAKLTINRIAAAGGNPTFKTTPNSKSSSLRS
jgi:hypothetical protein